MKLFVLFVSLCCLKLSLTAGPVISLEEEELDSFVQKKRIVMVEAYTPTCPHCKALAPEYLKAAKMAQKEKKPYFFVKIDASRNPGIGKKLEVRGYPTMKLYVEGLPIEYEGNRSAEAIFSFIDKKSGPQSTLLKDLDELNKLIPAKGLRV